MSMFRNLLISKKRNKLEPIWLEYLENSGWQQWIDTGIPYTFNTKISITFKYESDEPISVAGRNVLWNAYTLKGYLIVQHSQVLSFNDSKLYTASNGNPFPYIKHNIVISRNEIIYDGVKSELNNQDAIEASASIKLFRQLNEPDTTSSAKIYSCQIYDGDVLVRDFRPALNPQTLKPGMYDMVEGEWYYNQGEGEDFRYEYTFTTLDYIESDGEAYLTFPHKTNKEVRFILDYESTKTGGIIGAWSTLDNSIFMHSTRYINFMGNRTNNVSIIPQHRAVYDLSKQGLKIDNNLVWDIEDSITTTDIDDKKSLWFLFNVTNTIVDIGKCYSLSIYTNNIKDLDLIPVRKLDGTIGMYDFISGEYKLNSGTGKFKGYIGDIQVGESIEYISETRYPSYFESGLKGNKYTELWVNSEWLKNNSYPIVIGTPLSEPTYETRIYLRGENTFMGIRSTRYSQNGFNYISKDLIIVGNTSYTNPFVGIEDIPDTAETVTTMKIFNTIGTGFIGYNPNQGDKLYFAMIKDRTHLMAFIPCKKNNVVACYNPISKEIIPYSHENLLALNE